MSVFVTCVPVLECAFRAPLMQQRCGAWAGTPSTDWAGVRAEALRRISQGPDALQPLSVGGAVDVTVRAGGPARSSYLVGSVCWGVRLRRRGPVSRKEGVGHAALP